MIGNLGKGCYADLDGNNEHIGNRLQNADEIGNSNNEGMFPKLGAVTETLGTEDVVPVGVPVVPISEISVGNDAALSKRMENQASVKPVPAVTGVPVQHESQDTSEVIQVPKGHGVWLLAALVGERETRTLYREQCNWCKSRDFWLIDPQDPLSRVCRRCHPPPIMNTKKN